jgi:hypothetical protein
VNIGLDELTGTEQAVLLVLMAEARPVPNPELGRLGPKLEKAQREKLNRKGLIDSVQERRVWIHELTDGGWALCRRMFGAQVPDHPSGQGKALYTLMRSLDRYLTKADLPLADVFEPAGPTQPETSPSTDELVHRVYGRLAGQPGDWVALTQLRAELPDVARHDLDDTLRRMYRKPGVHLIPEENQKVLDEHDWQAAVVIGGDHKHLIAIEA